MVKKILLSGKKADNPLLKSPQFSELSFLRKVDLDISSSDVSGAKVTAGWQ